MKFPKLSTFTKPSLTSLRMQCSGCMEGFYGLESFEKHRVGDPELGTRRCLTPTEMSAVGLKEDEMGFWRGSFDPDKETRLQVLARARASKRSK